MNRRSSAFGLYLLWLVAAVTLFCKPIEAIGQYVLSINEMPVELSLGKEQSVVLTNGQKLRLTLTKKEILTHEGRFFSFRHRSEFSPNTKDLGEGVAQTMMTTAGGTVVIVQEYRSMDPAVMIDVMIQQLIKDDVRAGHKKGEKSFTKKLSSGKILKGKLVTLTRKEDQRIFNVLSYGNGDEGILIVTMADKNVDAEDQRLLDLLWESFAIKEL
jgi:hypothetical protein